ncbi:retrotransposon protein, putative, ty1-copia subclass [Tanacetum coccineum]|uniref:Retrotransposon protein, putative, ty1-copia subclass n=1 Tax=Tanacetum coccineum TaxID=301880 RepID=A0ABQ5F335_9ASTR
MGETLDRGIDGMKHNVLGIVPVAIIDHQLPFEYTITSRSIDVVMMTHPVQNINHSAFRSMFEREKLSGNNFNDWFRQLKLVLRFEKKMFVIEQRLPAAPAADSAANVLVEWNAIYDAYNEVACLILGSMTPELHRQFENSSPYDMIKELKAMFGKQARVKRYDLIQTFHACKQEEGKPVAAYVIQIKGYVDQLERLGYVLPHDLIVGLILNGLTKYFSGFVRNYNMYNMGKTVGELHAMLIEYEKGLPKKAKTPQVMMIKGVHRLVENGFVQCFTDFRISVSKNNVLYFNVIPSNGIYEIDMHDLVPNVNSIYNKRIEKLQQEGLLKSIDDESFDKCVSCLSGKMTRKLFPHHPERATDLLGIIHIDMCGPLRHVSRQGASYFITFTDDYSHYGYVYLLKHKHEVFETFKVFKNEVENQLGKTIKALRSDRDMIRSMMNLTTLALSFWDYALESATRILNMVPTKKVDKTPYELWYGKVPNLSYLKRNPMEVEEVEEHSLGDLNEPTSYKAAMLDPESNKWLDAMNAEMQSIIDTKVWVLVDLPPNCKTVGSKCIFKKKTDMDGIVHNYKASLVAKGYTQLYGVDYEETFSPVADIRAIRILIYIAAFYDYEIWQMDVKTAFLNGYLDEDIYMVQPEGFVDPKHPRKASGSNVTFLILYVDDIIIMGNHIPSLQSVKDYLGKCFAMKDLGEATFILGIKIYRDKSKRLIGLSQSDYMDKILKRYKMDNSKRGHIPMQERLDLNKTQGASTPEEVKRMQNVPYASAVGSIMYVVRCTRPDVAFAQNITSRFLQNPAECHWTAMKNILKYLRNTKDMFLVYGGNPEAKLRVDCYYNDGFETDRDDIKSQTGYVFVLNGGAVDWKSSKQSTTAMSATEAEYIAASEAAMEAVWIRKFISGLGIVPTINEPIKMFCDNSAALLIANEPGVQKGARHYHRRYHYVRECIELGEINLLKVHTDDNLADPFTKALPKGKLTQHARSIGLRLASSFM